MFGNPQSLQRTFTEASKHLLQPTENNPFSEDDRSDDDPIRPSCVGFQCETVSSFTLFL